MEALRLQAEDRGRLEYLVTLGGGDLWLEMEEKRLWKCEIREGKESRTPNPG